MKGWLRVTPKRRCPRCGKDTWCMVTEDGSVAVCMREVSDHPYTFKDGNIGYIHRLSELATSVEVRFEKAKEEVKVDWNSLLWGWSKRTKSTWIERLAQDLGVSPSALRALGCVYAQEHQAWAFPMRSGYGEVVGVRLRTATGQKWAIKGSHNAVFMPYTEPNENLVVIVEGPTDCAAALSIGYYAWGRPSCSGGMEDIRAACQRLHIRRAVIVADKDTDRPQKNGTYLNPGINGALTLSRHLPILHARVVLPTKDMREFVQMGGDKQLMDGIIRQALFVPPWDDDLLSILTQTTSTHDTRGTAQDRS